jgi:radical SAM protein with 4Fe4S-binding SPASM domain
VQKKHLAEDSPKEVLRENRFLAGQELEAIHHSLFHNYILCLDVHPTWECNLRCTHCCVIDRLKKKDDSELDVPATIDFVDRYLTHYDGVKQMRLRFAGGEPLLVPDKINGLIEGIRNVCSEHGSSFISMMTSNLAMPLDDVRLRSIELLDSITISIDGLQYYHDKQRRDVTKQEKSPFQRSIQNIKHLMMKGFRKKICVQAAVADDGIVDRIEYHKMMLRLGVLPENITFACHHSTDRQPEASETFQQHLRSLDVFDRPCCSWQGMNMLTIDSTNRIFTDFYKYIHIGNVTDDLDSLEAKRKSDVLDNMPVLHDPVCQECPVIGYCWGRCTNGYQLTQDSPSKFCNQAGLVKLSQDKFQRKEDDVISS